MRRASVAVIPVLLAAALTFATQGYGRGHAAALSPTSRAAPRHSSAPKRLVPFGFLGVMADGPLLNPATPADPEFAGMVQSGVESVRFVAYWSAVQPYPNLDAVPAGDRARYSLVDGIPTDWTTTDRLVRAGALRGLQLMPVVFTSPAWARKDPGRYYSPPADPAAYGRFVGAMARRYGPGGSFWKTPGLPYDPVHDWQIWNEPAGGATADGPSSNWDDPAPFQQRYVAMLRAARAQVKAVDPHGRIILAGNFGLSWHATDAIYQAHARGTFDAVSVNIFTRRVVDALDIVRHNRAVMNRNGDRKLPIMITEITWPSSLGMIPPPNGRDYEVTPSGQAALLTNAVDVFAAYRRPFNIERLYWYTWAAYDAGSDDPFIYAGLRVFAADGYTAKPAQAAYTSSALKLEGCRKLSSALRCTS